MIQRLLQKLRGFKSKEVPKEETVVVDHDNIYVQLKLALVRIEMTEIRLTASPASLGMIESFSDNMVNFIKSLTEVNDSLKEQKHVDQGMFYVRNIRSVRFDNFLFVHEGFYVDDVATKIQRVIQLIDDYYEHMKDAAEAPYGYLEYNHRQLYPYTKTLTGFLDALLDNFGS